MTIFFNVTDAVGSASNHGITRTERKLGAALSASSDVTFVLVRGGQLHEVDPDLVTRRLDPEEDRRRPVVEWFGTTETAPAAAPTIRSAAYAIARRLRGSADAPAAPVATLQPVAARPDDVLVSVGLDWVHGTVAVAEQLVFGVGGRFVGMCYDTIPVDHPEWVYPPQPARFAEYFRRLARVADPTLCISQSTQRDFLRLAPDLTPRSAPVVRLGADAAADVTTDALEWVDSVFEGRRYAIYCATIDRRKNHSLLYRAMKQMRQSGVDATLVFVGMIGSGVTDLVDAMRHDRSIAGRIAHVSGCDDSHLAALYKRAEFAVYPSLYEGWGLGVTEALAHQKPCIVASGSSLGEAGLGVCPELHPLRTSDWVQLMTGYFERTPTLPPVVLPTWQDAASDVLASALR